MQAIAWPDRLPPPDLLDAALLEDRRPREERLAVHLEKERRCMPSRGDEAAGQRPCGLFIGMKRLGIELAGECDDLIDRDVDSPIFNHFAERKIFEIKRVWHGRSIRETEMQDVAV